MLKDKSEIPNYDYMASILKESGWETWYHDDNWIKVEWVQQGKRYDMMGRSTESAYKNVISLQNKPPI